MSRKFKSSAGGALGSPTSLMGPRNRIKTVAAALVAVLALGAVLASAAAAAPAPRWKVAGSFLKSGETRSYSATLSGTGTLDWPGLLTFSLGKCNMSGKITGSAPEAPGGHKETVLSCEEISVEGAPACEVEPVVTEKMKGTLGWMEETGESNVITFEPESRAELTEVEIFECSLEAFYPVTGGGIYTFSPAATEVTEGTLVMGGSDTTTTEHYFRAGSPRPTVVSPSWFFGSRFVTLSGTYDMSLSSGESYGVFGG